MPNPQTQVRRVETNIHDEEGRQITRRGNTSTESSVSLGTASSPFDLIAESDFESSIRDVGGVTAVSGKFESDDANTFSIFVDWVDEDDNVVITSNPSALTDVTDVEFRLVARVGRFKLRVEDTSGASQNKVHGTAIAH